MIIMKENDLKNFKPVEQIDISQNDSINKIIRSLINTGFNAKRLALACEIYEKMIEDKECIKFFGLSGE